MSVKARLSATVDEELLQAAHLAVREGRVVSVSAWVNQALGLRAAQERRLLAMDEFVADYEAEHGEITAEEMRDAERRTRARAVVVRAAPVSDARTSPRLRRRTE